MKLLAMNKMFIQHNCFLLSHIFHLIVQGIFLFLLPLSTRALSDTAHKISNTDVVWIFNNKNSLRINP